MKSLFGTARHLLRTNIPAVQKKRALGFEALEARQLLSLNPSGFEQEMLEYLNEMRTDPDAGLARIVSSTNPLVATDPSVQAGLDWFGVDGDLLASQWDTLSTTQPLAWNESLYDAATGHGIAMRDADQQAHQLPGGASLSSRVVAEGYTGWSQLAENIYGYSQSPIFAHAGFAVDWGPGPGGMQSPAGHRLNMMSSGVREIGISAIAGLPGADLNPWIVTEDFGNRFALSGSVYVLGVLYDDANANDFYNAGEGIGGATVTVAGPGGSFTTSTMTAGGYQVLLPAHASPTTYTVTFSGGGLPAPMVQTVDVGSVNVKVDGIVGATLAMALDAASVSEGSTLSGTLTRSGSLSSPLIVSLSSSDGGEASLPVTVEIPAGLASAAFQLTGVNDSLIDGDQLVTVTAAASGFSGDQVNVQVLDVLPSGFTFSGSQLSIDGTPGNDAFGFAPGSDFHAVTRNGAVHQVSSHLADRIVIRTLSGDDTVAVTGGAGQDTARIRPTWSRMDGDNYQLYVYDAEQVDFAADDADYAYLFDSGGDDRFNAWPTTAQMVGDGFVHSVSGAGRVYAYATADGTDRAYLYDSTGDDTLIARPDFVILQGPGFYTNAQGFERVDAYATAGGSNDRALMYDSIGNDRLVGRPDFARFSGDNFDNYARGFERVNAYATAGGADDRAILYDSLGDDTLVARPDYALLRGDTFYNYTRGFDRVYAYATAGGNNDRATLYDSPGDDTLVARPDYAVLRGDEFYNYARGFDWVYAHATAGGDNDRATLYDSPGDDTLVARPDYAVLRGDEFYNYARGFDWVYAHATAGGDNDRATLYDSPGDDTLVARPDYALLRGDEFYNYARGFDWVYAHATAGGDNDRANLYDSLGDDTLVARPDYSLLRGDDFYNYARGFDRVNAYATSGGTDRGFLYDSEGDDVLIARPEYALLRGAGFFNYARGFDRVDARASAGGLLDRAYLYDGSGNDAFSAATNWGRLVGLDFYYDFRSFDRANVYGTAGGQNTWDADAVDYVLSQYGTWL